jgi:L-fucose isomerase-like protein
MFEIKKPKIGLAAVMSTPFRGDKEGNYRKDLQILEGMAAEFDFHFLPIDEGIYDVKQARSAAQRLEEWGADFILLQTASFASGDFLYPFTELNTKLGLWSVPEGSPSAEGGLPLNSFTASNLYNSIIRTKLGQENVPVKWFFGHPGQALFDQRLEITIKALRGLINLDGKKVALIGGVAPSFDNLIIDYQKPKDLLGVEILEFELDQVLKIAREFEDSQIESTVKDLQNDVDIKTGTSTSALEKSARVQRAIKLLAQEHGFEAVGLSCWPQFQSDYDLAVCSVMGRLNTIGLVAACEGDLTSAISMLTLRYITNGKVVTLMDLVSVDPSDESVLLWHCGPTSPTLADASGVTTQPLWLFDGPDGHQIGFHNDLVLKPGEGTVLGFTTDFEALLILTGKIDNQKPSYRGSRGWLTNLKLNGQQIPTPDLVQTLMVSGYQHHYPFVYGQLSDIGLEICGWLGLNPIKREKYTPYVR